MSDFADTRLSLAGVGAVPGLAKSSVSGGVATVAVSGTSVVALAPRGLTLAVNDPVLLLRSASRWYIVARYYAAAATVGEEDVVTPPAPNPTTTTGTLVCAPVETRSYRPAGPGPDWRTDTTDTLQGEYGGLGNNTGCAFYGTKPRSLVGAVVTSATIRVRRVSAGDYAVRTSTLRLVTQATRPSGAPTLTSSTTGPALAVNTSDLDFVVPDAWAQAMVDGTAGGLAVYESDGSPYMRFAGRGSWSGAWALTIKWRRTV